jgi:hypothetical protein
MNTHTIRLLNKLESKTKLWLVDNEESLDDFNRPSWSGNPQDRKNVNFHHFAEANGSEHNVFTTTLKQMEVN